ncbi:MAG: hypothetical protein VB013_04020 [Anaerolineaceae bacterium]|nr:hypothetical protein [Anaerolineaceae bacterium]
MKKSLRASQKILFTFLLLLFLVSCGSPASTEANINKTPTSTLDKDHTKILATQTLTQQTNLFYIEYPNLWTKIPENKMTLSLQNIVRDYGYAPDGSYWAVGNFGVLHKEINGKTTWYSMLNGLPVNLFDVLAISPEGEIWVGGINNTVLRFNGNEWIDEGSHFPNPTDPRTDWLCYSKTIRGIDFDQQGNPWVMNSGIELYTKVYDQWINYAFPKEILPIAGGGACPLGLRVNSYKDITIKRGGCCMQGPLAYHYDGSAWYQDNNYQAVDDLLAERHKGEADPNEKYLSLPVEDFPLPQEQTLPQEIYDDTQFGMDEQGGIWFTDGYYMFTNQNGKFENLSDVKGFTAFLPDLSNSQIINLSGNAIYYSYGQHFRMLDDILDDQGFNVYGNYYKSIDANKQLWLFAPQYGLIKVKAGIAEVLQTSPPAELTDSLTGGTLMLHDGRIAVGAVGALWLFDAQENTWQKLQLQDQTQLLTYLQQDTAGTIYAATDTGVIIITGSTFSFYEFESSTTLPKIITGPYGDSDCSFHKYYFIADHCHAFPYAYYSDFQYSAKYLKVTPDGTVFYINNRILSTLSEGKWKSYFLDNLDIIDATVDNDGAVWAFTGTNGLIRFTPDIFDYYQGYEE